MTKKTSLLIAVAIVSSIGLTSIAPAAYARDNQATMRGEGHRGGSGGLVRFTCNDQGSARLEKALTRVNEKLSLSDDQQLLFDDLKTAALTAQTDFADNCVKPVKNDGSDVVDRMRTRQANMSAHLSAMESVMPELEVFFDSLTDEQKNNIGKQRKSRGMHGRGHGSRN